MAIKIGGISWDVQINVGQATRALAGLDRQTKAFENRLRQTTTLFGGLGNNLGRFGTSLTGLQGRINALGGDLDALAKKAGKLNVRVRESSEEIEEHKKKVDAIRASYRNFAVLMGSVGGALSGYGALVAKVAKDSTILAARVQNLGTVVRVVGENAGYTAAQLGNFEDALRRSGITQRASRQSLAQLIQANIDLADSARLARIAQDAAVIAGIDSSEAFNRLVVAIQRNDVRLLRNLGIVINLNQVYQKFAQQQNRAATTLSVTEKRQIVLNEVFQKGQILTGTYEQSLGDVFKRMTSLQRIIEDTSVSFGKNFIPVLENVVDWLTKVLKAFQEGESFISGKTIAALGAASAAAGGLAVVLGSVTAAAVALTGAIAVGFGPLIAPAVAATVAAGGLAFSLVEAKVGALQLRNAIEEAGKEASQQVQSFYELADAVRRIKDLQTVDGGVTRILSDKERAQLESDVETLSTVFPMLRTQLKEALKLPNGSKEIINFLKTVYPELVQGDIERTYNLKKAVTDTFIAFQRAIVEAGGGYEKFYELSDKGVKGFIRSNAEFINSTKKLADAATAASVAEDRLTASQLARINGVQRAFREQSKALIDQGSRAINLLRKADNERIRLFRQTNLEALKMYEDDMAAVSDIDLVSKEELKKNQEAFLNGELERLRISRDERLKIIRAEFSAEEISHAERNQKILDAERVYQKQVVAVRLKAASDLADAEQAITDTTNARIAVVNNLNRALEKQQEAIDNLYEAEKLEAQEIPVVLINLRTKFLEVTQRLTAANNELASKMKDSQESLKGMGLSAEQVFEILSSESIPEGIAKTLNNAQLQTAEALIVQRKLFDKNSDYLTASQQVFAAKFERQRKTFLDRLVQQEKELNNRLVEVNRMGQKQINELSLEETRKRIEQINKGTESLEKFIDKQEDALRGRGLTGVSAVTKAFNQFEEQIKNVTTTAEAARLRELFPQIIAQHVKEATAALEEAQRKLRDFQEFGRAEAEQRDRAAVEARIKTLTDAGVSGFAFQAEVQRLQQRQAEERARQEKALQDEVQTQQQRKNQLLEEGLTGEQKLNSALTARESEFSVLAQLQQRQLDLQKQETAELEKQLQIIREKKASYDAASIEGGFRPGAVGPPSTPIPGLETAAAAAAASKTPSVPEADPTTYLPGFHGGTGKKAEALLKEIKALRIKKQSDDLESVKFLQEVLDGYQQDVDAVNDQRSFLKRIADESKAGRRSLDRMTGGRR